MAGQTVTQILGEITSVKHEMAVYTKLIEHLETFFLPSDVGDAQDSIYVEGCLEPVVAQSTIELVVHELQQKTGSLQERVVELELLEVGEGV